MSAAMAIALAGWALFLAVALAALRHVRRLELVAMAAHELRGAATTIELALASQRQNPRGPHAAFALAPALERLRGGLEDLDTARGRSSPPCATAVPLDPLLRGITSGWRPAPTFAGRRMSLTWEDGRPAVVRADRRRLAQAFSNVVANAVEHGSGEVELHGRRERDKVVVEVRDAGPSDAGGAARDRGRGRGLAITARAVEQAGGRLRLVSRPGRTVATIELPAAGEEAR